MNTALVKVKPKEPSEAELLAKAELKAEILAKAKTEFDGGLAGLRVRWHNCAELLAQANELCGATQTEMAKALGSGCSQSSVHYLLEWRRGGYKSDLPFDGMHVRAKLLAANKITRLVKAATPELPKRKIFDADKPVPEKLGWQGGNDKPVTRREPKQDMPSLTALAEFKYAVDTWLPKMKPTHRAEALTYVNTKGKKK